jgi:IS30 family transposase
MPGRRLTRDERIQIEAWWRAGWAVPVIAGQLGWDRSTVWREVKPNNSTKQLADRIVAVMSTCRPTYADP